MFISLRLIIAMFVSLISFHSVAAGEWKTLTKCEDLFSIQNNQSYHLTNDIDCNGIIITNKMMKKVEGVTLNGKKENGEGNYTIKNLKIIAIGSDLGLFSEFKKGTIENINFVNVDMTGGISSGSLVGYAVGAKFRGLNFTNLTVRGTAELGGIIGNSTDKTEIENITVRNPNVTGAIAVGGIIGQAEGTTVRNVVIEGSGNGLSTVQGLGAVGGLIGSVHGIEQQTSEVILANIRVNNINISAATRAAGGLIGQTYNNNYEYDTRVAVKILSSHVNATRENKGQITGGNYVGGLVGLYCDLSISDSNVSNIKITSKANGSGQSAHVGGLVGADGSQDACGFEPDEIRISISNSHVNAEIIGVSSAVGGLVGSAQQINIINSSTSGSTKGTFNVGGLVGYLQDTYYSNKDYENVIEKSYSTSSITGSSKVGGLIGYASINKNKGLFVNKSYATGAITGGFSDTGGLIGNASFSNKSLAIYNSYYATAGDNEGIVSRGSSTGGLIGTLLVDDLSEINIDYNYVAAPIKCEDASGLIGWVFPEDKEHKVKIKSSYWDIDKTGIKKSFGCTLEKCGRNTAQMKTRQNYFGWDFNEIWVIEKENYPRLAWQSTED